MTAAAFGVTPAGRLAVSFAWPISSGGWSLHWMMRFALLAVLFAIVGVSRLLLGNRRRYGELLESTPLATLDVVSRKNVDVRAAMVLARASGCAGLPFGFGFAAVASSLGAQ